MARKTLSQSATFEIDGLENALNFIKDDLEVEDGLTLYAVNMYRKHAGKKKAAKWCVSLSFSTPRDID